MRNVIPFPYGGRKSDGGPSLNRGEMIEQYKLYVRTETRSTSTVRIRDHYINKLSAECNVATATETEIETWLRRHGWAPTSINSALASIRHFYRWANRYGHLDHNPTTNLRRVAVPRQVARIADDRAITHAMMRAPVDTRVMIMLGAECGLRRAEIAHVHRSDISGEWLLVVGKGGHQRTVHLSPELLELLDYLPSEGWLFPSTHGGPLSVDAVYRRIKRVSGLNTHSLRHRAGTAAFKGTGNNLRAAQEFLGHASVATTQRYVHVTRDDLLRAANAARLAA